MELYFWKLKLPERNVLRSFQIGPLEAWENVIQRGTNCLWEHLKYGVWILSYNIFHHNCFLISQIGLVAVTSLTLVVSIQSSRSPATRLERKVKNPMDSIGAMAGHPSDEDEEKVRDQDEEKIMPRRGVLRIDSQRIELAFTRKENKFQQC